MRLTVFAATLAFLLWGTPAFAVDTDGDGVDDLIDNCTLSPNPAQDDTDEDSCGNLCDADYTNSGGVNFIDFGAFSQAFATTDEEKVHEEPVPGGTVGYPDWGFFVEAFGKPVGPCAPP